MALNMGGGKSLVLDLSPAEQALADLLGDCTGKSAGDIMEEVGGILQSQWRDNIADAGLVDKGTYLQAVEVRLLHADQKGAWVYVGTDASVNTGRRGMPYPIALEYGWTGRGGEDHPATNVGLRAFSKTRRGIVTTVGERLNTKIKARKRRSTKRKG